MWHWCLTSPSTALQGRVSRGCGKGSQGWLSGQEARKRNAWHDEGWTLDSDGQGQALAPALASQVQRLSSCVYWSTSWVPGVSEDARDTAMCLCSWNNSSKPCTRDDTKWPAGMEGNVMNKEVDPAPGLKMSCKLSERGCGIGVSRCLF